MNVLDQKWRRRLLKKAKDIATWSKDDSTKVGAVIVSPDGGPISWGFNGMPMGIDDNVPERHERPYKYKWMAHAEQNALDLSKGSVEGGIMFVSFSPCTTCARSIIQKKISAVVVDTNFTAENMPERWREDMIVAKEMLLEAGIKYLDDIPDE
jgi:dCMP deaminase